MQPASHALSPTHASEEYPTAVIDMQYPKTYRFTWRDRLRPLGFLLAAVFVGLSRSFGNAGNSAWLVWVWTAPFMLFPLWHLWRLWGSVVLEDGTIRIVRCGFEQRYPLGEVFATRRRHPVWGDVLLLMCPRGLVHLPMNEELAETLLQDVMGDELLPPEFAPTLGPASLAPTRFDLSPPTVARHAVARIVGMACTVPVLVLLGVTGNSPLERALCIAGALVAVLIFLVVRSRLIYPSRELRFTATALELNQGMRTQALPYDEIRRVEYRRGPWLGKRLEVVGSSLTIPISLEVTNVCQIHRQLEDRCTNATLDTAPSWAGHRLEVPDDSVYRVDAVGVHRGLIGVLLPLFLVAFSVPMFWFGSVRFAARFLAIGGSPIIVLWMLYDYFRTRAYVFTSDTIRIERHRGARSWPVSKLLGIDQTRDSDGPALSILFTNGSLTIPGNNVSVPLPEVARSLNAMYFPPESADAIPDTAEA
ncbi:MAG: hypothetical protein GY851_31760 [bacterium]|nr:hypothetical protein [bacterium]